MKAGNGTMLDAGVDLRDQTEPDAGTEQQPPSRERHARTPPAALRKCARCLRKDHSTSSPVPIYPAARESSAAKRRNPSIRLAHRSAARYGSWHVARLLADEG